MFATPAFAQTAVGGGPAFIQNLPPAFVQLFPFILIIVVMYVLVIRPQSRRAREHRQMISALRRGDTVVTGGGLIGKIARVSDDEALVELAENVRVRVLKSTISEVRSKTEPVPTADASDDVEKPARTGKGGKGRTAKPEPVGTQTRESDKPD